MKNKKLFLIYILFLIICLIALISFPILGNKKRIYYLSDFKFDETHINKTLELNGFDIEKTKKLFTIDNILNNNALTNYIFTNKNITNYSYGFKVKYDNKEFKTSNIYEAYIDTNKILKDNNFIKYIEIDRNGNPFGILISTKEIDSDKIDNIAYNLKLHPIILIIFILLFFYMFILYIYNKKINFLYDRNYKKMYLSMYLNIYFLYFI